LLWICSTKVVIPPQSRVGIDVISVDAVAQGG
jgi:hypothetical protein